MTDSSKSKKIDLVQDYDHFILDELSSGMSVNEIVTFEEFKVMREHFSNPENLLNYVTPNAGGAVASVAGAILSNPRVQRAMEQGVDAVSRGGAEAAARIARRLADGTPFVKVKRAFGDTGGSGGSGGATGAGGSGSPGNPFALNRMNYNPKPVQVRLDTGIKSRGFGDYYPESKPEMHILELTSVQMKVPNSVGSKLATFFNTVITFNFQNEAQERINFNLDAVTKFTADELRNWINRYVYAYSVFASLTAIKNYCDEPLQMNEGMRRLRSFFTPTVMDELAQLGNMLDGTPAPPKLREFVHFVYGAPFEVGNNPGAQVRMIIPYTLAQTSTSEPFSPFLNALPSGLVTGCITDLFDSRATTALIAKVCPGWLPGKGNTPSGAAVPENSPNWHTLWENLPYNINVIGTVYSVGPKVSGENDDCVYGSTADILDGAITGLWTGYDTTSTAVGIEKFRPGFMIPVSSQFVDAAGSSYSNRISFTYDVVLGGSGFLLSATGTNQQSYMRSETYTITNNGLEHKIIWPGRERINNINIASSRESAYEMFNKFLDLSSTSPKKKFNSKRRRGKIQEDDMSDLDV